MDKIVLIGFGSGLGGILRYLCSSYINKFFARSFPFGTLSVNVLGCLLMGLLFVLILDRFSDLNGTIRALILVGFLGGFTTFSSFSIETINLFENGATMHALLYIFLSVFLCLGATIIGILLGRQL